MNLPIPNKTQTPTDNLIHLALLARLRSLPFDGYLKVVALLLGEIGYWDVRPAGRRDFKGRNGRDGVSGYDLLATRSSRLTLVQVKQFEADRPLFQRSLDELRGEALLITTSHFSPSINRGVLRSAPIAPVVTLDGVELADLLSRHRIGVTSEGELDDALFKELEAEASGNRPSDCTGSLILVTVGVSKVSRTSSKVQRLQASRTVRFS
jgi:hypothetical protein